MLWLHVKLEIGYRKRVSIFCENDLHRVLFATLSRIFLRNRFTVPLLVLLLLVFQRTCHCSTHLFILVSCDCNKFSFFEDIRSESGVGQLQNIIGTHKMKSGLVLMHRIQYSLEKKEKYGHKRILTSKNLLWFVQFLQD